MASSVSQGHDGLHGGPHWQPGALEGALLTSLSTWAFRMLSQNE